MRINGQLTKCDRCGYLLFCEKYGHGEADGRGAVGAGEILQGRVRFQVLTATV